MNQQTLIKELADNPEVITMLLQGVLSELEPVSDKTVREWSEEWYNVYIKPRSITDKSVEMYQEKLKLYILPAIGNKKMSEITEIDLQKIINSANSSKSTAQKVKIVLVAMFRKAKKLGIIQRDPSVDLELPKAAQGKRRSITDAERAAILKMCETHQAGLYIQTLLYTGVRPGEAIALKWSDIDFDKRLLNVNKAVESGASRIKSTKTEAGERQIPIPDVLFNQYSAARRRDGGIIFRQPLTGRRHTHSSINDYWHNFRRELDISLGAEVYRNKIVKSKLADDLVPYCLRHTYCTDLQRAGVPLNVARYLMGHSDVTVTSGIYTDTTPDVLVSAVGLLDKYYAL